MLINLPLNKIVHYSTTKNCWCRFAQTSTVAEMAITLNVAFAQWLVKTPATEIAGEDTSHGDRTQLLEGLKRLTH